MGVVSTQPFPRVQVNGLLLGDERCYILVQQNVMSDQKEQQTELALVHE